MMMSAIMFGMISTLISCGKALLASYITVYLFTKILTFIYHIILRRCEEHDTTECNGLQGDALLFAQPPPPNEDCPICFLPLPASFSATSYQSCCGKNLCNGCIYGFVKSAADKIDPTCPFCRSPMNIQDDEVIKQIKKRINAGDKEAVYQLGRGYEKGHCGLPRDEKKALELFEKAGELGVVAAYTNIGYFYMRGQVVERDVQKAEECFGRAAIGGNIDGRWNLGLMEEFEYTNMHRALKHYRISAKCGDISSLEKIRDFHRYGYATKKEYAEALVSYQSYLALTGSEQRDKAAVFTEMLLGESK